VGPNRFVKIGLQLYQVDQKSYLLDFRFFEQSPGLLALRKCNQRIIFNLTIIKILKEEKEAEANEPQKAAAVDKEIGHHNVMEFFELCADLIGSLAR
jgi:5'-AMP-activated protein kinase catalytic alpha subunit